MTKEKWIQYRIGHVLKAYGIGSQAVKDKWTETIRTRFQLLPTSLTKAQKQEIERYLWNAAGKAFLDRKPNNLYFRPLLWMGYLLAFEIALAIVLPITPMFGFFAWFLSDIFCFIVFLLESINAFKHWQKWSCLEGVAYVGGALCAFGSFCQSLMILVFAHIDIKFSSEFVFPGIIKAFFVHYETDLTTVRWVEPLGYRVELLFFFALAFFIAFLVLYLKEQSTIKNSKL